MRTRTLAIVLLSCLPYACITGGVDSEDLVEASAISPALRLEYAEAAYEADPDDPYTNIELAMAWVALERPDWRRAETYAKFAFDSGELDAQAGRVLGKIYWEVGQPLETVDTWRRARAADPNAVRDSDYLYALRTALATARIFKKHQTEIRLRYELRDFIEARHRDFDDGTLGEHHKHKIVEEISPNAFANMFSDAIDDAVDEGARDEVTAFLKDLARTKDADDPIHSLLSAQDEED